MTDPDPDSGHGTRTATDTDLLTVPVGGAAATSPFELHVEIETPERVSIRYDLAGLGSRFAAGTIDGTLLALVILSILVCAIFFLNISFNDFDKHAAYLMFGATGVMIAATWLYYLGFELLWNGQTPGKRALKLRVVADGGGPAPASAIVVRNVLRVADMVPVFFLVHVLGGIVMFISGRSKRLGDMAAGTIVVQERDVAIDLARLSRGVVERLGDGELSTDDRTSAQRFLTRLRELKADRRAAVARCVLESIRERHELPEGDPVALLTALARGRRPAELVDMAGPVADGDSAA